MRKGGVRDGAEGEAGIRSWKDQCDMVQLSSKSTFIHIFLFVLLLDVRLEKPFQSCLLLSKGW